MPSALVPPGVDTARFREVAPRDPGRILYVGPVSRAYAWKGFADLFEAFARLASRVPHAKLRAVGGGDLVQHYLGEAAKRGLAHRVSFMGRVADDALPREYSRAEVVALPSTSEAESFGMVLAEANACERPVVGTRVGGIPHFVRDGENGLLVEPRDPDGLAVALERLLHEPDHARRLARAGHERVLREHRWSELAHRTVEVYEAAHARALARPSALARAPDA